MVVRKYLELKEVEVGSPGPDEVKVTNFAIGLNYIDTYHRSGLYPIKLPGYWFRGFRKNRRSRFKCN